MSGLATTVEVLATFGGVGAGLTMLVSELAPSRAALGPALSRLHRPVLVDARRTARGACPIGSASFSPVDTASRDSSPAPNSDSWTARWKAFSRRK